VVITSCGELSLSILPSELVFSGPTSQIPHPALYVGIFVPILILLPGSIAALFIIGE